MSNSSYESDAAFANRQAAIALLIIDMINPFDFPGPDTLEPRALAIVPAIENLIRQFDALECPVIYVNDNFGEWHSDRSALVDRALETDNPVARRLRPRDKDFFVLKPQFSGFYATNLPVLLPNRRHPSGLGRNCCRHMHPLHCCRCTYARLCALDPGRCSGR